MRAQAVATLLQLRLPYDSKKPRNYWDDLENVRREIVEFNEEHGLEKDRMPTRFAARTRS